MLAYVHRMPCREDDSVTAKDLSKVRACCVFVLASFTDSLSFISVKGKADMLRSDYSSETKRLVYYF